MRIQQTFVVRDGERCPVLVAVVTPGCEQMHVQILVDGQIVKHELTVTEYFNLPKTITKETERRCDYDNCRK